MKLYFVNLILPVGLMLCACDPVQLVYFRNYTDKNLTVQVNHSYNIEYDSIYYRISYTDELLENDEFNNVDYDKIIIPQMLNEPDYRINLPAYSITRICPSVIGFPIQEIFVLRNSETDTIRLFDCKTDAGITPKNTNVERKGISAFIIHYK